MATWDPKEVKALLGGVLIDGFSDETFVQFDFDNPRWTKKVGADGAGCFSKSNDESATLKISLMPNSIGNEVLNGFWQADGIINGGKFPIDVLHIPSGTNIIGLEARIMKGPSLGWEKEAKPIEWEIGILQAHVKYGSLQN